MGQRSQIYVRFPVKNGYGLIANYYQWNYGERMISRCRYALEYIRDARIQDYLDWYFEDTHYYEHFRRYLDVNFDMKDVVISSDIIKEYYEYGYEYWNEADQTLERKFNDYVFDFQDNNDGKLLIDIRKDGVKYAFLGREADAADIMSAEKYMDWEYEKDRDGHTWRQSKYIDVDTCAENIEAIGMLAELMTEDEVKDFLNCKYENEAEIPDYSEN